jgi:UDP-N-acetyl-D-mannosaminuronic acid dehydrogenase
MVLGQVMETNNVCIIGVGYVGLTLAVTLAEKGFNVHAIESNDSTFTSLSNGIPHFHEKGIGPALKKHLGKNLFVHKEIPNMNMSVFVICVGTPLDPLTKKPIMKYIVSATQEVSRKLSNESLVILRSTVPVGATREVVKPLLEKSGKIFYLSFCPERTVEGKALIELKELPQIVGGMDLKSVDISSDLFRKITPTIVEVTSLEAAEMIKLIDNSYRDVIFAYANEIALISEAFKLDALELIKAASVSSPRTYVPLPGLVGGSCLEKDPHILFEVSKGKGYTPHLIKDSRNINEMLPGHIVKKILYYLERKKIAIPSAKIFISGFAFKGRPETDDIRGSLTLNILTELKKAGAKNICGHDFIVSKENIEALGIPFSPINEGFRGADCVIIATNHLRYDSLEPSEFAPLMKKGAIMVDIWRVFDINVFKELGVHYSGVGVG